MTLAFGYRLGARLARSAPETPRLRLARTAGAAWFALDRRRRRLALENYATVLGVDPGDARVLKVARGAFENYAAAMAEFVLLGDLGPEEVERRGSLAGREHVEAALAERRGCVLALPHMGSWDFAGAYAGVLGYPVTAVAERLPGSLDRAVAGSRRRLGLEILPLGGRVFRRLAEALAANRLVALLCDLPHGPGLEVEFFGRRAVVPRGPAALARETGAPLLTVGIYSDRPGHHRFLVDPPLPPPAASGANARERDSALAQAIMGRFEALIRPRPDQWFAFLRLFRD